MKREIFNAYVAKVIERFMITKGELFAKNKRRDLVDARFLLYRLCVNRGIGIRYILQYMRENGYVISHNSIINGLAYMDRKIAKDTDYVAIIRDIEQCVLS